MDTDSLRLFVRAAEKLNISGAGRELGLAPAVASARLAKLEREVGAELLHRSTRKVSLSLEGAEFLPFAREILAQRNAAMAALGHGQAEPVGTIRFAASSTFAQLYLMPLLPEFLSRYPGLKLDLRLSDVPFDLLEGSFDLALRSAALEDSSLKARKLAQTDAVLCASPDYLAKNGIPETPADLTGHDLIAFQCMQDRRLVSASGEYAVLRYTEANCRVVIDDGANQRRAVEAGLGIAINAYWNVHASFERGTLVRVLPAWRIEDRRALWLVYPRSNVLTAKVRVLIDFLVEKLGHNPPWANTPQLYSESE
ncbi:LysR family transcriptional regulator [Erythrobacter mangrovi]|uniref:LysR family transcriptional regulator n=1 Tax=Erythrobacter mangrovi TaxID=2739433 RepID=A0A7D3XYH4_9SPHN|nr:LysR family transcriptional regulator [Erythrobacter mangrovi]QKG70532.1 LysR family transcriptional regulator [Erythrobacter mangrovi]